VAEAFKRGGDGRLHAQFHPREKALLQVLAEQLSGIIGKPTAAAATDDPFDAIVAQLSSEVVRPIDDPVHARLFPRAHRDDEDAADEFDRAALAQLRHGRADRTTAFLATLSSPNDEVALTVEQAHQWLTVLTDLRLMLGTSVDVVGEGRGRQDSGVTPQEAMYISVYDWLSWLQETLVACFL
jgi:hypothetical protein